MSLALDGAQDTTQDSPAAHPRALEAALQRRSGPDSPLIRN